MRFFCIILFLLFFGISTSDAQRLFGKNIDVTSEGFGKDSLAALEDAKKNASENAYKILISSTTETQDDKLLKDTVSAHSYGLIKKYAVLESVQKDSIFHIKIKAKVYFSKLVGGRDRVKSKIKIKKLKK